MFQSALGPKAERYEDDGRAFAMPQEAVSIRARPEGRALLATIGAPGRARNAFQSSLGPKAERYGGASALAPHLHKMFQSSLGPKAERYVFTPTA